MHRVSSSKPQSSLLLIFALPKTPLSNSSSNSKTTMPISPKLFPISLFFTLIFQISSAKTTITAILRDELACTMCTTCDNPCDPVLYPPPPPIYYSPPPPSSVPVPTPTVTYNSPPLPPSTSNGNGNGNGYNGGQYYPSQGGNFPVPPPPNPIVNYFPYYYYNPPAGSGERLVPMQSIAPTVVLVIGWFILF